jgi:hypothetical protein
MDCGLKLIKQLEENYLASNQEIREYILSKVIELESETSCGLVMIIK